MDDASMPGYELEDLSAGELVLFFILLGIFSGLFHLVTP